MPESAQTAIGLTVRVSPEVGDAIREIAQRTGQEHTEIVENALWLDDRIRKIASS